MAERRYGQDARAKTRARASASSVLSTALAVNATATNAPTMTRIGALSSVAARLTNDAVSPPVTATLFQNDLTHYLEFDSIRWDG